MRGLGAAVARAVGRTDALQERGGRSVAPRLLLLHLLLDVVLDDVAVVVVFPHDGGVRGAEQTHGLPRNPRAPGCLQTTGESADRRRGSRKQLSFSCLQRRSFIVRSAHSVAEYPVTCEEAHLQLRRARRFSGLFPVLLSNACG